MSRGRGGRGGGRGGVAKSFNREQLTALGVGANELLPGIVSQPPPLYPLLDRRPVPFNVSSVDDSDYLLILRQDYIDHMQLSGSFIKMPEDQKNQAVQEIDKLVAQLPAEKEKYDWALFPSELRPKVLAKRVKTINKVSKEVNVEEKLKALEKLEEKGSSTRVGDEKEEEIIEEEEIEDQDEEMDDGTDYANNYFDNGEAYEDEDDNLDDGPIY